MVTLLSYAAYKGEGVSKWGQTPLEGMPKMHWPGAQPHIATHTYWWDVA